MPSARFLKLKDFRGSNEGIFDASCDYGFH